MLSMFTFRVDFEQRILANSSIHHLPADVIRHSSTYFRPGCASHATVKASDWRLVGRSYVAWVFSRSERERKRVRTVTMPEIADQEVAGEYKRKLERNTVWNG